MLKYSFNNQHGVTEYEIINTSNKPSFCIAYHSYAD